MTLSILESSKDLKELTGTCLVSALCSLFLLVFSYIYSLFSHGVHSPFMTFLFAWPLLLCAVPALVCLHVRRIPGPSVLSSLFWHTGTAAVTVSSLLRGIFEIAGNSSVYQTALMIAGLLFLAVGMILYAAGIIIRRLNSATII